MRVDFSAGTITNESTGKSWSAQPFPPFIQGMIAADGLVNYMRKEMNS